LHRTSFEILEKREMMAADLSTVRLSSFLASATASARASTASAAVSPTKPGTVTPPAAATPSASSATQVVDWYSTNLADTALRDLTRNNAKDGTLSRSDVLSLFTQVEKDGTVSSNEFSDLKKLIANNSLFGTNTYVQVLAADVVLGNKANARFQGQALGNLVAGSSASQLDKLVRKWFLGQDHPTTMSGVSYRQASGSLFAHAPVYADIVQGMTGDCYYLSSLAEAALKNPSYINNMFIVNGDGTYTVRFYNNGKSDYVTVDSMLPTTSQGIFVYANMGQTASNKNNTLWVALAEKAYAQMNESGWLRANLGDSGHNTYDAISGGYMTDALKQITNRNAGFANVDKNTFVAALNAGSMITFGSQTNPTDGVVGNHAYALLSYNAAAQTLTLFNPWGVNNRYAPGTVTLSWAQMKTDFAIMEYTV
jgi:hypothetical protein